MALGLFQNIDSNRRKSVVLIVLAVVLLAGVGAVLGLYAAGTPWFGLAAAGAVGLVLGLIAWKQGSSIVLATAGAKELQREEDPVLFNVVEELTIASGLPMPRVFLVPDDAMNAFATGISPDRAAIAVTLGLRRRLSRDELQGVVAHELSHVGNYDTRIMILLAVIVGTVAMLCDWALMSFRFSSVGRSRSDRGHPAIAIVALVLAIIAPIAATIIQFAVSRRREYLADATAAAMTRNPGALADALERLAEGGGRLRTANRGTQHLFIVNPFRARQELSNPFATHPPLAERIARLRAIAGGAATVRS